MGIKHVTSCPYTPQQNGVAERANRTICEGARCMLANFNLPKSLWPYAVVYAAYIRNRCPSQPINYMTPHQLRYGKISNMRKIRTFGCTAFVFTPDNLRRKSDYKSKTCRFLGIASNQNGYIVQLENGQIIVSRDVKGFQELKDKETGQFEDDSILIPRTQKTKHTEPNEEPQTETRNLNSKSDKNDEMSDEESSEAEETETNGNKKTRNSGGTNAITRFGRQVRQPTRFDHEYLYAMKQIEHNEPETYQEATTCTEADDWIEQ